MKFEMEPFTESHWSGFSGCEEFSDGSQPLFGVDEEKGFIVIADGTGISFTTTSDSVDSFWILNPASTGSDWNHEIARKVVERLVPVDLGVLRALGAKEIL